MLPRALLKWESRRFSLLQPCAPLLGSAWYGGSAMTRKNIHLCKNNWKTCQKMPTSIACSRLSKKKESLTEKRHGKPFPSTDRKSRRIAKTVGAGVRGSMKSCQSRPHCKISFLAGLRREKLKNIGPLKEDSP